MSNQTSANAAETNTSIPQSDTARTELEMTDLKGKAAVQEAAGDGSEQAPAVPEASSKPTPPSQGTQPTAPLSSTTTQDEAAAAPSEEAAAQASAEPDIAAPSQPPAITDPSTLKVGITLLMPSGHRSEWRFDKKYLEKRNVTVPEENPFKISVYTLKELMLREWQEEWGPQPMSPSAIRLITLGKLLDDKATLEECRFMTHSLTILHMTVKPQDMIDEEDARMSKHGGGRDRDGTGRTPRCRCVIL